MVLQNYLQKAAYLNMLLIKRGLQRISKSNTAVVVTLKSDDGSENIELQVNDILFLKSAQNYVEVHYIIGQETKQVLLRNTLKAILGDLERFEAFMLCHRSYIVNLQQVITINGNSRGYTVLLKNCYTVIPVSRHKTEEFDAAISGLGAK